MSDLTCHETFSDTERDSACPSSCNKNCTQSTENAKQVKISCEQNISQSQNFGKMRHVRKLEFDTVPSSGRKPDVINLDDIVGTCLDDLYNDDGSKTRDGTATNNRSISRPITCDSDLGDTTKEKKSFQAKGTTPSITGVISKEAGNCSLECTKFEVLEQTIGRVQKQLKSDLILEYVLDKVLNAKYTEMLVRGDEDDLGEVLHTYGRYRTYQENGKTVVKRDPVWNEIQQRQAQS